MTAHRSRALPALAGAAATLALLAVLTGALLTAGIAPATSAPGAQDRAGAFFSAAPTCTPEVGSGSACTRPASNVSTANLVVGCCVAAKGASSGWRVGDDVYSVTRAGNEPAWSTVRGRYWKNVANDPAQAAQWDEANLARMKTGRAPQRYNPDKGGMESMELSHEPVPAREGGRDFVPRWPQDHAANDPYRHPGY